MGIENKTKRTGCLAIFPRQQKNLFAWQKQASRVAKWRALESWCVILLKQYFVKYSARCEMKDGGSLSTTKWQCCLLLALGIPGKTSSGMRSISVLSIAEGLHAYNPPCLWLSRFKRHPGQPHTGKAKRLGCCVATRSDQSRTY